MDNKLKHLEFIQNVIARMNNNSFLIKGWTVTLVSALFALAAKDSNKNYVLVSFVVVPTFWILDGFFISCERQYRDLYNNVAAKAETQIDFNMNTKAYDRGSRTWASGVLSKTLLPFYGICLFSTVIVMFLLK